MTELEKLDQEISVLRETIAQERAEIGEGFPADTLDARRIHLHLLQNELAGLLTEKRSLES